MAQQTAPLQPWMTFLEEGASALGQRVGFVRRQSKLNAAVFVQSLVLGCLKRPTASLNDFAKCSQALGVPITGAGIDERITERAAALLQGLFEQALRDFRQATPLPSALLKQFNGIHLTDSTQIQLPPVFQSVFAGSGGSASAAALKLTLSFDYLTGTMSAVELTAGRVPDQSSSIPLVGAEPGSLHLFDLGFFRRALFVALQDSGAFFISRLNVRVALYPAAQAPALDLLRLLEAQTTSCAEYPVCFKEGTTFYPVRLIAGKLPPALVEERRRKARAQARRKGRTLSSRHLALLAWELFITNVPAPQLNAESVLLMYRLRWQIELLFKLWKSQAKLALVTTWRPARLLCQLYARLLGLVFFHWMVAPYRIFHTRELSLPKAFALLQEAAASLVRVLARHGYGARAWLARFLSDCTRFALKTRRRKSPSTYCRLNPGG